MKKGVHTEVMVLRRMYIKNELKEYIHFNKLTPEMLHRLVDRIEIKEDGSPKIYYLQMIF
ncbi:hypothetical protein BO219_10065 [Anoxybacillus kestanbolensis]|uniref:DUF4368 domain-containing protein n=1 Tax=Anoxybacillus kestanbolensis TaxID=227476 RepID=A0A1V3FKS3_9BACL|nr:DUF4368 domain-containing protein [Anoxybacillus kestanbolensis]OOE02104.1 hypothetical protein BO219_10065 [Anoxybacillus kestanbolensis]